MRCSLYLSAGCLADPLALADSLSFILPPSMLQTGVVGVPVPSIEAKLVDFPDANYFSTNSPPQGEVWLRGGSISKGYFKRDDITAEAYTEDGWLKTGDIGQWNADGTLSIIDRKKNLVKLAGGEYIALERLESIYKSCGLVSNICLVADSNANKPMAVSFWSFTSAPSIPLTFASRRSSSLVRNPRPLSPSLRADLRYHTDESNLKHFLSDKNISGGDDLESQCESDEVCKAVVAELNAVGKKAGLKPMEVSPYRIQLPRAPRLPHSTSSSLSLSSSSADADSFFRSQTLQTAILGSEEWTPQNGLLSAASKLQRKAIMSRFEDRVKVSTSRFTLAELANESLLQAVYP